MSSDCRNGYGATRFDLTLRLNIRRRENTSANVLVLRFVDEIWENQESGLVNCIPEIPRVFGLSQHDRPVLPQERDVLDVHSQESGRAVLYARQSSTFGG